MKKEYSITTPISPQIIKELWAGDQVLLNGVIYTARDMAHQRIIQALRKKRSLPCDLKGHTIYYAGPAPTPPGAVIGSCGPTTASRMDPFTPAIIEQCGVCAVIGKGIRSLEVVNVLKRKKAVYFLAFGGLGALYSQCVIEKKAVAYEDLGPEAIYALTVRDFPVIVGIDIFGDDIYTKR